jgi:hypothetical protein
MTMPKHKMMNSLMTPLQSRKGDESFRIHSGLEQHVQVSQLTVVMNMTPSPMFINNNTTNYPIPPIYQRPNNCR